MNWVFLDVAAILRLHEERIIQFGGSPGLRDAGLLESAVLRAEFKVQYEPDASIAVVTATLGFGLIKNHAFVDGNKRVGLAAMNVFLWLNGYRLTGPEQERVDVIQRVAASEMSESDLAAWIASVIVPRG